MSWQAYPKCIVGVQLDDLTEREQALRNEERGYDIWYEGSLQRRFASESPTSYQTSTRVALPFMVEEEDYGFNNGPGDDAWGGIAGFSLSDMSLVQKAPFVAILPELRSAVAARLSALGRPTKPSEVEIIEYEVMG